MIAVAVVRVVAMIAVVGVVAGVADTNPHSTGSNKFQFPAK